MALTEKRAEAKRLYIDKALSCSAIAEQLGVDAGTVYRWKAEAAGKGEAWDWDCQRQIRSMSFAELQDAFREAIASTLAKIKKNPEELFKHADALSKIMKSLERIDPRSQYLGSIADLIRVTNQWLAEHQPELKTRLDPYWDNIYQELSNYCTSKGLF
jgi:transposase